MADQNPPNPLARRLFFGAGLAAAVTGTTMLRPDPAEAAATTNSTPWKLGGNGADSSKYFLGTTNANDLVFKTNNVERLRVMSDGKVGIGKSTPNAALDVAGEIRGTSSGSGGAFTGTSATGRGVSARGVNYGVYADTGSLSTGYGVYASGFYGVYGETATGQGVTGVASGTNASGVVGVATGGGGVGVAASGTARGVSAQGTNYGVYATGSGTDGTTCGLYGTTSRGYGVRGAATATNGTGVRGDADAFAGVGVLGSANATSGTGVYGTGGACGVKGQSTDGNGVLGQSSTGYAIYSQGNAYVQGTLSKSAGSFQIDHPMDPDHQWLRHSFVESPDMMNVYNGNVTTGSGGTAVVDLPDYFHALNRDFRYQLTVIGGSGFPQAKIASPIAGGRFTIATSEPGVEVSWQVTGIRQDDYARAHPIVVEERKTGSAAGARAFVPKGSKARTIDHSAMAGVER